MKKFKLINVIAFLFLLLFTQSGATQESTLNIPVRNDPGEYIRALVIYVTVPNDNTPKYDLTIWDPPPNPETATRPVNPYEGTNGRLIHNEVGDPNIFFMERYPDYTISDYFCEMSMGDYDVIGDEYYLITPKPEAFYANLFGQGAHAPMNEYIIKYLDTITEPPIEWERYDNWEKVGGNWIFGDGDGTVEMVMIIYRNLPLNYYYAPPPEINPHYQWFWNAYVGGKPHLAFGSITFGDVTINWDNGITAMNFRHNTTHSEIIMIHEYSHKIFGSAFHTNSHVSHGMMTPAHDMSTYVMAPWERSASQVEYINPIIINSSKTETLSDYVESGQVLKIPIPETTNNFFWVSNHQKISKYDGVLRGGKDCYLLNFTEQDPYCEDGKGIIIQREGSGCASYVYEPYDIITAEGKYYWHYDKTVYVPWQNYHFSFGKNFDIYEEDFPSNINARYFGKDEYHKSPSHFLSNDPCSDGFFIDFRCRGDKEDAFNMGFDEIFSPYSNPSSKVCNSSHGENITIALVGESGGEIDVEIYIEDDAQALYDLPPSRPKNLNITKEFTPTGGFHPKLTWDDNIEPDFDGTIGDGGDYNIYRGKSYDCNTEPSHYVLIQIVDHDVTEYIDGSVTLYEDDPGGGGCQNEYVTYSYKIKAVDKHPGGIPQKESVYSDKSLISGWEVPCAIENIENLILNSGETPSEFALKQNFPNPFNPSTNIQFDLPNDVNVSIKVYDITGKEIAVLVNDFKKAGSYIVSFNGSKLSSGVYFYKIEAGSFTDIKRMVLIK